MMQVAIVSPAANLRSYPAFFIVETTTRPSPAASATAVPEIPAKITEATIVTCANPPRIRPVSMAAKRKMRSVIPVEFISSAARMKNGIARNSNLLHAATMYCGITTRGTSTTRTRLISEVSNIETATGTRSRNSSANRPRTMNVIMFRSRSCHARWSRRRSRCANHLSPRSCRAAADRRSRRRRASAHSRSHPLAP